MTTLQQIHKELMFLKQEVELIRDILVEEGEFTKKARKQLAEARKTPLSEYISLEDLNSKNV